MVHSTPTDTPAPGNPASDTPSPVPIAPLSPDIVTSGCQALEWGYSPFGSKTVFNGDWEEFLDFRLVCSTVLLRIPLLDSPRPRVVPGRPGSRRTSPEPTAAGNHGFDALYDAHHRTTRSTNHDAQGTFAATVSVCSEPSTVRSPARL